MAPTTSHGDTRTAAWAYAGHIHGLAHAIATAASYDEMDATVTTVADRVVAAAVHQLPEHATGLGKQSGDADGSRPSSNRPSPTIE